MPASFELGPKPLINVETFGHEGHRVIVIDNVLSAPEALVDFAVSKATFKPAAAGQNFYPGVRAPAPQAYAIPIAQLVRTLAAEYLAIDTSRLSGARSAFAIASIPSEQLSIAQSQPHFDTVHPSQVATVHYLCDAKHGGTAFYRHRATGFEAISGPRATKFQQDLAEELKQAKTNSGAGYIVRENALFEQTKCVDAAFDRMIIYKSNLLHSGLVNAETLSSDPAKGRLTATTFMRFA